MNKTAPQQVDHVVIRFAGDSGDGMQLVGGQFTRSSALLGNDVATLPDYPAEIRAPAGTQEGVSGFQIQFAGHDIHTPGDEVDVLVAMNPAALVKNLISLRSAGIVVVNSDKFKAADLAKARLDTNPLEDGTLSEYRSILAPITTLTREAVAPFGLNNKDADRCKNFFALGMMYWLYSRDPQTTIDFLERKFKSPYKEANKAALQAGHDFAGTIELFQNPYEVPTAEFPAGDYRNITGNAALAIGLATAAAKTGLNLFYGSYPITPASDILHSLAPFKNYGVATYQAEDEIAAVCASIGASYGGHIGVTGTSGPGIALKSEAIGLAVITELPLVIIDVQRGGPSTGLPTKTEQSDLLQNFYGRNGEAPCAILCTRSPSDCFEVALEAVRIATTYMMPVVLLSDGYIANGAEPWAIPDIDQIPEMKVTFRTDPEGFQPYMRDADTLSRPWVVPGTPGLEHRIGGLEKADGSGNVSYDPDNHQRMCELRAEKVQRIADSLPPTEISGDDSGLLVLGWGSTWGAIRTGVGACRSKGMKVGHVHLRHLNPLPKDLGEILARYDKVLIPEMNLGQLLKIIRSEYLIDAVGLNKIKGQPFLTREIAAAIEEHA
ncbi:MAG TPA: 2-oxoacid:acceptor oxidoreductase subunit alpha [Deltaproteobacteria bacterium]|nr:2-oxoacid:acceptor oxidoreductase subunit alpha [Deltaproteobacteria bacterium]